MTNDNIEWAIYNAVEVAKENGYTLEIKLTKLGTKQNVKNVEK